MTTEKKEYTVFVVEDSDVYRSLLVHELEGASGNGNQLEYTVHEFSSGERCLQHLHLNPDVVVLDYFLNGNGYIHNIDGLTVLRRLRKFSPATEVIVVSCQENIDVMKRFIEGGIRQYIRKEGLGQHRTREAVHGAIREKERKKIRSRLLRTAASFVFTLFVAAFIYWITTIR